MASGSTRYQYDGTGLSKQTDTLGDTYFTALPDGTLLSETVPSGTYAGTYYYLSDGAGSVAAVTDGSGAIRDSYAYDPMGNVTASGSVPNPFTYQGGMHDSSTHVYYLGSGYYDPASGQSFGCQDRGWVDPGEDLCGEDEYDPTGRGPGRSRGFTTLAETPPENTIVGGPGPEEGSDGGGAWGDFLTPSEEQGILRSANRPFNRYRTVAEGAPQKHATNPAFKGIKPTAANADAIVKRILEDPQMYSVGRNYIEIFNSKGQGIRLNKNTLMFVTFLDMNLL